MYASQQCYSIVLYSEPTTRTFFILVIVEQSTDKLQTTLRNHSFDQYVPR